MKKSVLILGAIAFISCSKERLEDTVDPQANSETEVISFEVGKAETVMDAPSTPKVDTIYIESFSLTREPDFFKNNDKLSYQHGDTIRLSFDNLLTSFEFTRGQTKGYFNFKKAPSNSENPSPNE